MHIGIENFGANDIMLIRQKNARAIKEYIKNQLKQDRESDQLSLFDSRYPFKWEDDNKWMVVMPIKKTLVDCQ